MTIDELKQMQVDGSFHHATYRDIGKCWEGLYIYKRDSEGLRGFALAGAFNNYYRDPNPECEKAMELIKGMHIGSYDNG